MFSQAGATLELHQIRYFLAVYNARNFTRAAERCNVSQPALTNAIKKLEAELDGPLFHRGRGGAQLTTLGERVLPRCQRLAQESADITAIASNHRNLKHVPLRVGVLKTVGPNRLATCFASFRQRAPEVELEVRVLTHMALLNGLEDASLEVVITNADVITRPWAVVKPIYGEDYVVVLPPSHALANQDEVALADLNGHRYIDRLACELREQVAEACDAAGFELYAFYRTEDEAWIECLVRAGVGVALMPEHSLVSSDSVVRPLVNPKVHRRISMVRSADHPATPAAKLFWKMMTAPTPT